MSCQGSLSQVVYNALWDLYDSTNGIHWTWSTQLPVSTIWTFPSDLSTPCSDNWQGLTCSRDNCSLEEITLIAFGLSGSLPSSLGNISSLTGLQLSDNSINGTFQSELGNLLFMQHLDLANNWISGPIPCELGNLQSAQLLVLSNNMLTGSIPSQLGNLEHLQYLEINSNFLFGAIPSDLGKLKLIRYLDLGGNDLTGSIPCELGSLLLMEGLVLNINNLIGSIPSELGNLLLLRELLLYINQLSSTIPSEFGNFRMLQIFELYRNSLSGTIPSELGNLQSVLHIILYGNILSGMIPCELGNLQPLQYLLLNVNYLTGTIPFELGNLTSNLVLVLGVNSLTGTIPCELGNLRSNQNLVLNSNSLTGPIPTELAILESMQYLLLYANSLSGTIPYEFENLHMMKYLLLDSNKLTGVLDGDVIGRMSLLTYLSLSQNCISGSIPVELSSSNKALTSFFISNNLITGSIPFEKSHYWLLEKVDISSNFITGTIDGLSNQDRMSQINASNNMFSGSLPQTFSCFHLDSLDLSSNFIQGYIGLQFLNCSQLKNFALGSNLLIGTIPRYFEKFPILVSLNVSKNGFSGTLLSRFNSSKHLHSLDLSWNRLTGTLPPQLFSLASLQDVFLFSNCFSGSIPEAICSNSGLRYIVLNQLTSNCGSGVPNSLKPIFRGIVSQRLMSGSIPSCVWGMNGLKLLQLSGNGLKGSIGEMTNSSLRSLLLSGNQLTGTIPAWIQSSSTLEQLDLSQNRLSGTLIRSLQITSAATFFSVSVNRLSGRIPDTLLSGSHNLSLDVLNGNQFSCSSTEDLSGWGSVFSATNLPPTDVNHDTYTCGSSLFDDCLLMAFVLFFALLVRVIVDFRKFLSKVIHDAAKTFDRSGGWTILTCLAGILLILFASFHGSPSLVQFRTHTDQYLWTTTAAFLRGWAPVVILLLAVGVGEATLANLFHKTIVPLRLSTKRRMLPQVHWLGALAYTTAHVLNIVTVVATNSAYVYAIFNGLPRGQLFAVQFFLGCFKLTWSNVAIPRFLRHMSSLQVSDVDSHRVFMSLFAFIGGPFISTFFSASNCFLYIIVAQKSVTSMVEVPQYICSAVCNSYCPYDECYFDCPSKCQFQPTSVETTSTSTWIYSYQCSSTLLLDYIPVLISSMAVSGLLLPCIVTIQFARNGQFKALLGQFAPRSVVIGNNFDVARLGRILRVKSLVNLTTMLTFGFACPLLGVLVILDFVIWSWLREVLVSEQKKFLLSISTGRPVSSDDKSNVLLTFKRLSKGALENVKPSSSDCLTVFSFVGMFWSLFVFDMIGDVYGDLAGGLSMLVPLLMGTAIWFLVKFHCVHREPDKFISRSVSEVGIELTDVKLFANPVHVVKASHNTT